MAGVSQFASFDGARIAYREMGSGRTLLLLHGFISDAQQNWMDTGIARTLAEAGFRVIAPDLRGHGQSAAPEDAASYPPDALAMDQLALIRHLGLSDFDLVGYSLGARTAMRMLVKGAAPRRVVLGGMGASGITAVAARREFFRNAIEKGEAAANPLAGKFIRARMAERGLRAQALLHVLDQQVDTPPAVLSTIRTPMLIVSGRDDADNGSAEELAVLMPQAKAQRISGNHLSAVGTELSAAITAFLTA